MFCAIYVAFRLQSVRVQDLPAHTRIIYNTDHHSTLEPLVHLLINHEVFVQRSLPYAVSQILMRFLDQYEASRGILTYSPSYHQEAAAPRSLSAFAAQA